MFLCFCVFAECLGAGGLDQRKTATLSRHYYPEGGWGWVVAACCVGVHVLGPGLQLSAGILLGPAQRKYRVTITDTGNHIYLIIITINQIFYLKL